MYSIRTRKFRTINVLPLDDKDKTSATKESTSLRLRKIVVIPGRSSRRY